MKVLALDQMVSLPLQVVEFLFRIHHHQVLQRAIQLYCVHLLPLSFCEHAQPHVPVALLGDEPLSLALHVQLILDRDDHALHALLLLFPTEPLERHPYPFQLFLFQLVSMHLPQLVQLVSASIPLHRDQPTPIVLFQEQLSSVQPHLQDLSDVFDQPLEQVAPALPSISVISKPLPIRILVQRGQIVWQLLQSCVFLLPHGVSFLLMLLLQVFYFELLPISDVPVQPQHLLIVFSQVRVVLNDEPLPQLALRQVLQLFPPQVVFYVREQFLIVFKPLLKLTDA